MAAAEGFTRELLLFVDNPLRLKYGWIKNPIGSAAGGETAPVHKIWMGNIEYSVEHLGVIDKSGRQAYKVISASS